MKLELENSEQKNNLYLFRASGVNGRYGDSVVGYYVGELGKGNSFEKMVFFKEIRDAIKYFDTRKVEKIAGEGEK